MVDRTFVSGKSLLVGGSALHVKGVTYGTFSPAAHGAFPEKGRVAEDFALMAEGAINAIRTYTVPPHWLLDLAWEAGLRVMVGLPWETHVAFLDEGCERSIAARVRAGVEQCESHPAVLCFAIGNEIPASIVRWHGARRVERFLLELYREAKKADAEALVTYANFPSTEYLQLPFLDLVAFNVFLESERGFEAYLARLQNIAGDRPLIVSETGLDSRRSGAEAQAAALEWQIRAAFGAGCAGTFAFAWTDEWQRGGFDVLDWDFGLVDRERRPKPALAAVRGAYSDVPFAGDRQWPRVSVIVSTYNGASTLGKCLSAVSRLRYPDFETIVVDDGSTDGTAAIAEHAGVRVISTENRGLSAARNVGLQATSGQVVAYLDDDAYPDEHWLSHLVAGLADERYVGVGGPNIPPPDGTVAECVANAPGGPVHVLLADTEAEHIPGCNMAFRREALEAIGGFDPQFRIAGDDVDVCWRLQERGGALAFSPGAVVWHHRRGSVRAYLRQQYEYGKAEALLERKWPERYNRGGHVNWSGQVYGGNAGRPGTAWRGRIYYGMWGTGLFQSIYHPSSSVVASLPLMPEWYFVVAGLACLAALGLLWAPLLLALPLLVCAAGSTLFAAVSAAARASFTHPAGSRVSGVRLRALTATLHVLQPLARLAGRLRHGLSPWRRRCARLLALPRRRRASVWSERWAPPERWIEGVERRVRPDCHAVTRGTHWDRWDLQVRSGALGVARVLCAVEEHGAGRQLVRFRAWPKWSRAPLGLAVLMAGLGVAAAADGAALAAAVLATLSLAVAGFAVYGCALATGILINGIEQQRDAARLPAELGDMQSAPRPPAVRREHPVAGAARAEIPRDAALTGVSLNPGGDTAAGGKAAAARARNGGRFG
jgi:O-antigen biosynthesis protein